MARTYVGHLSERDPLYHYFQHDILPQMRPNHPQAEFRVFQMKGTNEVFLYEEKHSQVQIVGKFFVGHNGHSPSKATNKMEQEFHNLHLLRSYGLSGQPHYVVRPLGYNSWLNNVLVEEYCSGRSLSSVINAALYEGQRGLLFGKLTALAYFLATLHNRTANGHGVDFNEDCAYFDRIVQKLTTHRFINFEDASEFYWLRDRWREQPRMWEDKQVLVHGDATPANFLFGDGLSVIAIDLERMKRADRVFDVGRIAGELQHFFLQASGNKYAAEPYIGHFLWEYSCHFPDRHSAFRSITGRVAFQMALTLLRIARNTWVTSGYRGRLVEEAKLILRSF